MGARVILVVQKWNKKCASCTETGKNGKNIIGEFFSWNEDDGNSTISIYYTL